MNTTYEIPITDTIQVAWQKVSGSKGIIWAFASIMFVAWIAFALLNSLLFSNAHTLNYIFDVIIQIIVLLFQIGILNIGIQRAFDKPLDISQGFKAFNLKTAFRIIGLFIIQFIIFVPLTTLILLPVLVSTAVIRLALPGGIMSFIFTLILSLFLLITLYLAMRLWPAMAFVIDKNAGPLQAIKLSFEATRNNVWRLFVIFVVQAVVLVLSFLTLGIAFIWTFPFIIILYGLIYKRLLVNAEDVALLEAK